MRPQLLFHLCIIILDLLGLFVAFCLVLLAFSEDSVVCGSSEEHVLSCLQDEAVV